MTQSQPQSPLFPYTTLFRSWPVLPEVSPSGATILIPLTSRAMVAVSPEITVAVGPVASCSVGAAVLTDRKSTRLNSSHEWISYAVYCLNKKRVDSDNGRSGN